MSDQYTIQLEGDDVEGHGARIGFSPEDDEWLKSRPQANIRVRIAPGDDDDTEGHSHSSALRVIVSDDDDTEGHAISLNFPTVQEADAFRRRILATGLIAGTIVLGAVGGAAVGSQLAADAGAQGAQANQGYVQAATNEAARQGAAGAQAAEADQAYVQAATGEAARQGAAGAQAAQADEAYVQAATGEAARQGAAGAQAAEADAGYVQAGTNEAARQGGSTTSDNADDEANSGLGPR